jgi:hypothetical protein
MMMIDDDDDDDDDGCCLLSLVAKPVTSFCPHMLQSRLSQLQTMDGWMALPYRLVLAERRSKMILLLLLMLMLC